MPDQQHDQETDGGDLDQLDRREPRVERGVAVPEGMGRQIVEGPVVGAFRDDEVHRRGPGDVLEDANRFREWNRRAPEDEAEQYDERRRDEQDGEGPSVRRGGPFLIPGRRAAHQEIIVGLSPCAASSDSGARS
jgi:hypothetical protein